MKFLFLIFSASFLGFTVNPNPTTELNGAIKCVVVLHPSGCDYFICATADDYLVLEWYGGNDPDKGDLLVGNFNSYGFVDGYNLTQEKSLKVWVEDYWLSKESAIEKFKDKCE
jgi:hypothetical protein